MQTVNHWSSDQTATNPEPMISVDMIERFDINGPRYTSYPTADRFVEAFGQAEYRQALKVPKVGGLTLPLSMYIHIPFCESLCFYCACNKIVTKKKSRAREYLDYLKKEIDLHAAYFDHYPSLSQLHLGGGSPTFFSDEELQELIAYIAEYFHLPEQCEIAIEVDPRTVDGARLRKLSQIGFNRISFGVQDLDAEVQTAVHREQSYQQIHELIIASRAYHFKSVNLDLIYGLPKQTVQSFDQTLNQVIDLRPDRIALYAYAHLPERFKPQRRILREDLPSGEAKVTIMANAIRRLLDAGYVYIGMDHFALPEDSLAVAKRQGRLHRNFQGYSTQADGDLIGLGVSAIGKIGVNYSQNAKSIEDYYDALDQGRFPTARGIMLSRDDLLRRAVIMAIMCQGELDFESLEIAYMIDFKHYFSKELAQLNTHEYDDLIQLGNHSLRVTNIGWFFVRAIAMVFDKYLQSSLNSAKFSKII